MTNFSSVPRLKIMQIPHLNTIVIKQIGRNFFVATPDSIVIDIPGLSFILKFLVLNEIVSYRILEGILEEYRSAKGNE